MANKSSPFGRSAAGRQIQNPSPLKSSGYPTMLKLRWASKLKAAGGYAAMFYFFVMLAVLGILLTAFTILALKDIYLARAGSIGLKNMYANEGFIEDTIIRSKTAGLADTENGETLAVGDAVVTASLLSEGSAKSYLFSSQINNKYFGNEVLAIDSPGPSVKIKKWQDSQ